MADAAVVVMALLRTVAAEDMPLVEDTAEDIVVAEGATHPTRLVSLLKVGVSELCFPLIHLCRIDTSW